MHVQNAPVAGVSKNNNIKARGAQLFQNGESDVQAETQKLQSGDWISVRAATKRRGAFEIDKGQVIDINVQNGTLAVRYWCSNDNDRSSGEKPWLGLGKVEEHREDMKFDEIIKLIKFA
jgi:hypothetical protein